VLRTIEEHEVGGAGQLDDLNPACVDELAAQRGRGTDRVRVPGRRVAGEFVVVAQRPGSSASRDLLGLRLGLCRGPGVRGGNCVLKHHVDPIDGKPAISCCGAVDALAKGAGQSERHPSLARFLAFASRHEKILR